MTELHQRHLLEQLSEHSTNPNYEPPGRDEMEAGTQVGIELSEMAYNRHWRVFYKDDGACISARTWYLASAQQFARDVCDMCCIHENSWNSSFDKLLLIFFNTRYLRPFPDRFFLRLRYPGKAHALRKMARGFQRFHQRCGSDRRGGIPCRCGW